MDLKQRKIYLILKERHSECFGFNDLFICAELEESALTKDEVSELMSSSELVKVVRLGRTIGRVLMDSDNILTLYSGKALKVKLRRLPNTGKKTHRAVITITQDKPVNVTAPGVIVYLEFDHYCNDCR